MLFRSRLARSCFYGAQRHLGGRLPEVAPGEETVAACDEATLAFEEAMHGLDFTRALSVADAFGREANRRWDAASKAAKDDEDAYAAALADAFRSLRTLTLLMHPAAPTGCEKVREHLAIPADLLFSWDHAFEGVTELVGAMGEAVADHGLVELPPRTDFFEKHPSQYR